MSTPYLTLEDSEGTVYNFPLDFWLTSEPVGASQNIVNKSYASGGKNIADGFLEAKIITLTGAIRADNNSSLETKLRSFSKAILKGGKLRITDDPISRYIDVKDPVLSIENGYRTEKNIIVSYIAENPFWVDDTETTDTQILAGNGTFYVDNSGSDFLVFPTIEIENDQGVDNPGVKLTNNSDGGMEFVYNDVSFLSGDLLIVDSENGTVQKNNNNAFENLESPARFLRLQPLNNEFEYEGAACTIRVKFRKAYLISV